MLFSAVLDANAYINLECKDEPSEALAELSRHSREARIKLYVTPELTTELARDSDTKRQSRQISHTSKFPIIPIDNQGKIETIAYELSSILFPNAMSERQGANRKSDCVQLAYAINNNSDFFITEDAAILRKKDILRINYLIEVLNPGSIIAKLKEMERSDKREIVTLKPPKLKIRLAEKKDFKIIKDLLLPLDTDYPDFINSWLPNQFKDSKAIIKVIEIDNSAIAVSISKDKGNGVIKLCTFYVNKDYGKKGYGHHLLQNEINSWVAKGYRKAIVTMPSTNNELVKFFNSRGFLIDGVSPKRYNRAPEIILGRHFLHRIIDESDMERFSEEFMRDYLCCDKFSDNCEWIPTLFAENCAIPVRFKPFKMTFSRDESGFSIELIDIENNEVFDFWDVYRLESDLFPMMIKWQERNAAIIPIQENWAEMLFEHNEDQPKLFEDSARVRLRADNIYYRAPTEHGHVKRGTHILFYISGKLGEVVAAARVVSEEKGPAEEMFGKYEQLGVFKLNDVLMAADKSTGNVQAIRFDYLETFPKNILYSDLKKLVSSINLSTSYSIPFDMYLQIRSMGGLFSQDGRHIVSET